MTATAQPQAQAAQPNTPTLWGVMDLNARTTPRRHDIPVSFDARGFPEQVQTYLLNSQKPTPMPKEHALQFCKDKAFVVTDENGVRQRPIEKAPETAAQVPEGFTLAAWDELSDEALFRRCKVHATSVAITEQSSRNQMVAFLTTVGRPTPGVSRGSENIIREDPDAAKMVDLSADLHR